MPSHHVADCRRGIAPDSSDFDLFESVENSDSGAGRNASRSRQTQKHRLRQSLLSRLWEHQGLEIAQR